MTAIHDAMACPIDGTALVMSERQGIEIDYCPACRGVWLDRGELDKIIERGRDDRPGQTATQAADPWPDGRHERRGDYRHKRRKSFFEDLFD